MAAGFFRKAALEKLSTPEKLDQLIKVTSPKAWLSLATLVLIIGTGIGWAFLGSVKTKLTVIGVLLGGEIHEVVSTAQGQLVRLNVQVGDQVHSNEIVAFIEQPQLYQQIEDVKASLQERTHELETLLSFGNQDSRIQANLIRQQRSNIELQIDTHRKNVTFLKNQLERENRLLDKGLITKSEIAHTEQQIENAKNAIANLQAKKVQTSSQKLNLGYDLEQKISLQQQRIAETARRLEHLKERYDIQTNIRSAYDGQVVEVLTDAGVVVGQGSPLFKLKNKTKTTEDSLRGVLYIPSQDGKKIKEGMEALVVPSTVQPQEYGFMKGKITYVSEFPVTQKGIMTSVKNDQIVKRMLSVGAPFEVYVKFEKDTTAPSGFRWTSALGPDLVIHEGTSCMGKITVKTEPPIAMVVPALKKFFDLY